MISKNELLFKEIESKYIVWFQQTNKYIVFDTIVAEIIQKMASQESENDIIKWCELTLEIPNNEAKNFFNDINKLVKKVSKVENNQSRKISKHIVPKSFEASYYYKINDLILFIQYENELLESYVHPKFAHLEIKKTTDIHHNIQVFNSEDKIVLNIDNSEIGSWNRTDEIHFFQGKFSMSLIILMYQKQENEWIGVFHASAITNGNDSLLFLGDSGNGKSTSLALLTAHGFDCIADDFVPIGMDENIYPFPAAISIKKNSVDTLLPFFPELKTSAEFHFKRLNKIVRYLPTKTLKNERNNYCKAFIFIKYEKNSELKLNEISPIKAFEKLVPDSWISPIKENAKQFLDWFSDIPSYELTYSKTEDLTTSVSKIFNDDV